MDTSQESIIEMLQLAKSYAKQVTFWNEKHRSVLYKCLKIVSLLQKSNRKTRSSAAKSRRKKKIGSIIPHYPMYLWPRLTDTNDSKNFFRLSEDNFNKLLHLVGADLKRCETCAHNTIPPEEQLSITLQFLATGESYKSLECLTKISHSYLVYCIPRVCGVIWKNLKDLYLSFPNKTEHWEKIAEEFETKWQFPLCLGALDGKHINLNAPNSIILLTLTDANCKFIYVDVCANSRNKICKVLRDSTLQSVLDNGEINLPPGKIIGNNRLLPYVIIGDSAFTCQKHLITPFLEQSNISERITYNARIIKARQVVQRSFAILSTRFRFFQKSINIRNASNIELITKACCVLHNFLMDNSSKYTDIKNMSYTSTAECYNEQTNQLATFETVREEYMNYFNEDQKHEFIENCK